MAWKAGTTGVAAATAAAMLLAIAVAGCQRPAQGAADVPHTPIPKAEPRFWMEAKDGQVQYRGVVADEAARRAVASALEAATGASGTLEIDPRTLPAAWAPALGDAAKALRQTGGRLDFVGKRIELRGELDPEQRATLHRRLQGLYPGYTLAGALEGVDPRLALPNPGDTSGLLVFLNAAPIRFESDSGMLASSGIDGVARAARGMRAAGSAARVEALIHPGREAATEQARALGEQRIDALLTQFALRGILPPQVTARVAATAGGAEGMVEFVAPPPATAPEG